MATSDSKRRAIGGVMLVLPIVLVKAAALISSSSGPATAQARSTPVSAIIVAAQTPPATAVSKEQETAARHLRKLRDQPLGSLPFYFPPREPEAVAQAPVKADPGLPKIVVDSILVRSVGNIAVIDGKLYLMGAMIGKTGWRITAIDGDSRAVTIEEVATGRSAVMKVALPN